MKKMGYISIGIIVALLMSLAVGVYGEGLSLVGNKVGSEWSLSVDGEEIGIVPIINGRSYAPVRQIAELAGFDVEFEEGAVYLLTNNEQINEMEEPVKENEEIPVDKPAPVEVVVDLEKQLRMVESKISGLLAEEHGEKLVINPSSNIKGERLDFAVKRLAEIEAELIELESQKAELESKIEAAK